MLLTVFYIHQFITALIFTDVVETALLWLLIKYVFSKKSINTKEILFAGIFASFATIPYVWFVFPNIAPTLPYNTTLFFSETFAFVVEAGFYRTYLKIDAKTAFSVSFVCNAASFLLARLLRAHGVWLYW